MYAYILNLLIVCSGKKGGGSEPEKDDVSPMEAIIPTLPDVKMCAAKAIARSARSGKSHQTIFIILFPLKPSCYTIFFPC